MRSPVVFLIFNRPETTVRVFAEIAKARPPKLLVVADGPREDHPEDAARCAETRAIVEQVDWPCEVLRDYAQTNMGCKRRVSSGLDWAFETVSEAIILEDDCLPHPDFFPFCDELLARYRDDERVMMIGGTNYLLQVNVPESYLFSHHYAVWGWASWRRAWQNYDLKISDWPALKARGCLQYYYPQRYVSKYYDTAFDTVYSGKMDTWDYQWSYCCLFNNGLSAIPRVNLISNIGFSGTHVAEADLSSPLFAMPSYALDVEHLQHPRRVMPNDGFDHVLFERMLKVSLAKRAKQGLAAIAWKLGSLMRVGERGRPREEVVLGADCPRSLGR